ncbi:MAG: NTP transferase domain-containing protein [Promicromonosporaceae bacterium]|nr:NTP transferase domain-containing protein [Promicromonosporaceae bacterium]
MTGFDAIVLAGGRASRLGGTPKPGLVLDGATLLDRALDAVQGAASVVVVGPDDLDAPGVLRTREAPPFGGPVAGIDAGLRALDRAGAPGVVVLLAVDVPGASPAIPRLRAALADDGDGTCLVRDGHPQWLVAALRRPALADALQTLRAEAGSVHDQPVRRLAALLRLTLVPDDDGASADVDTWDDLARLEAARTKGTTP